MTCNGCKHATRRWRVFRYVLWCLMFGKVQKVGCIYHSKGGKE
jgi:hypothetical protein